AEYDPSIGVLTKHDPVMLMVARPSTFNSRAALDAGVTVSPSIRSTGPTMPPVTMTAISQGRSARRSGASGGSRPRKRRPKWTSPRPAPEPRYSKPASSQGSTSPTSSLAKGVLAPNRAAETRPRRAPGGIRGSGNRQLRKDRGSRNHEHGQV